MEQRDGRESEKETERKRKKKRQREDRKKGWSGGQIKLIRQCNCWIAKT